MEFLLNFACQSVFLPYGVTIVPVVNCVGKEFNFLKIYRSMTSNRERRMYNILTHHYFSLHTCMVLSIY